MSSQYRICHNCGASLTPGETYCPRCGAEYVEPIVQKPGEFEPFPPDQVNASGQTEPYEAQPQQPVVLPPPQQQAPYPPQGQGYEQPSPPQPYADGGYAQQAPGQVGGPPQPPESDTRQGLNTSLVIGLVVAAVLLLVLVGGLFYVLGQRNNTTPGTTPTPGVTPTATPTATPGTTPTPTPTSVSFQVTTINLTVNPLSIAGKSCGTQLTITYTATFNVLPKGPGGAVQFTYTTDGGRNTKTGVVQFSPGQTSMQFQFPASGTLELNGAFPGAGQVTTTSPNTISSQAVTPQGTCTPASPTP
jgi:zinc ribbon protein